jgi:hypothetical protein
LAQNLGTHLFLEFRIFALVVWIIGHTSWSRSNLMALPGKSCMVVEIGLFLETDVEGIRFPNENENF